MTATKKTETSTNEQNEEENIDKIRDILFGVQVRDFENRFSKLEKHFEEEFEKFRSETVKQLAALEETIEKGNLALTGRIFNEQDSRKSALKDLADEFKIASEKNQTEISRLIDKTENSEREIRTSLSEQSKSLVNLVEKKQQEVVERLVTMAEELKDSKSDRKSLSQAFAEISRLLSDEEEDSEEALNREIDLRIIENDI